MKEIINLYKSVIVQIATPYSTGTGFYIKDANLIVTNEHVIRDNREVVINGEGFEKQITKVIFSDIHHDLAFLQTPDIIDAPAVELSDCKEMEPGEVVTAVGHPFGLKYSAAQGIISNIEEEKNDLHYIQHDAALNPGNSGGALVNTNGDLIGINTAISSQTGSYIGYSFAVPSNTARKVVQDIMEFGTVKKAVLGISAITSPELLSSNYGVEDLEGVYISGVEEGSSAKEAGLKEGDIIKQIDYLEIKKFSDLTGYLASKRPQDAVVIKVSRNGKLSDFKVVLKEKQTALLPIIGFTVKNLSPEDQKRFKIKNGVKIIGVPVAYENYGLIGKVVVSIDDKPIINIDKATELFQNINKFNRTSISMINENGERERLIFQ